MKNLKKASQSNSISTIDAANNQSHTINYPNAHQSLSNYKQTDQEKPNPTTLERSLASITNDSITTNNMPYFNSNDKEVNTKSKKKHKKNTKKSSQIDPSNEDESNENPWLPVSSKKIKSEKKQIMLAEAERNKETELIASVQSVEKSSKSKKKKRSAKSKPQEELISTTESLEIISPPIPSDKPESRLIEIFSSENTQCASKNLTNTLTSDSKSVPETSLDNATLKAHLMSKEAECQVLRAEVVRMHTDIIQLKTAALSIQYTNQPTEPSENSTKLVKTKPASHTKQTQCDLETPSTPLPADDNATTPSVIVIQTLQNEIGRLAKENTIINQRNANLENRLDVCKKRLNTTKSEIHRACSDAVKKAESGVQQRLQQFEALLKEANDNLSEKTNLVIAMSNEVQELTRSNKHSEKELHCVKHENETLRIANQTLQQELTSEKTRLSDENHALVDHLSKTEQELTLSINASNLNSQALQDARSKISDLEDNVKLEREISASLKLRVSELEVESEANRRLAIQLKDNLQLLNSKQLEEKIEQEQQLTNTNLAPSKADVFSECSILSNDNDNALVECCKDCCDRSAEVEFCKNVLQSTESILAELQASVDKEEVKWRSSLQLFTSENSSLKKQVHDLTELKRTFVKKSLQNVSSTNGTVVRENGDCDKVDVEDSDSEHSQLFKQKISTKPSGTADLVNGSVNGGGTFDADYVAF